MNDFNYLGCFQNGIFSAVPYRHHQNRMLWHVEVIKKTGEESSIKRGMRVISMNASTACIDAIRAYKKVLDEESVQFDRQVKERALKRELQNSKE